MKQVNTLFWDVGGVLLTNAWDRDERERAIAQFGLDKAAFETRHKAAVTEFEEGKLTLDDYLQRTVFYEQRSFTREQFTEYMCSQSKPKNDVLEFARRLSNKYLMATINNESRELNEYRIRQFGLSDIFDLFVSSCYVGLRKPDERIYHLALDITQQRPDECCFIDDRPVNLEAAAQIGLKTVQMKGFDQLKSGLQDLGVAP